jgi:hypothetical protein
MIVLPVLTSVAVLGVSATVRVSRFLAPPRTPPTYAGPRPEPAEAGYLSHTESIQIGAPLDAFRQWMHHAELAELLVGPDNMPRVLRTDAIRGTWDPDQNRVGDRRRVVLDDGHFAAEEVLVDNPEVFRYIVWGYTNYAGLMIDHAIGEFHFEAEGDRTRLTWSYSFQPRSAIVRSLLAKFVGGPWADLMRTTLQAMQERGERHAPANPDRHRHPTRS